MTVQWDARARAEATVQAEHMGAWLAHDPAYRPTDPATIIAHLEGLEAALADAVRLLSQYFYREQHASGPGLNSREVGDFLTRYALPKERNR